MSFEKVSFSSSVGNFGIRALKSVTGLLRVEKCELLCRPNKASATWAVTDDTWRNAGRLVDWHVGFSYAPEFFFF